MLPNLLPHPCPQEELADL
jgi:hypothetical protein